MTEEEKSKTFKAAVVMISVLVMLGIMFWFIFLNHPATAAQTTLPKMVGGC